jgi:hypothetical protein
MLKRIVITLQAHLLWNLIKHKKILNVVEKILGSEILSNPVQNTRIKQPEKTLPKKSILDGLSGRNPLAPRCSSIIY